MVSMGKQRSKDPVMAKVRRLIEESGLTQQKLGERMGYAPESARQSVSQFLKSGDPQIGTLRRFAKAMKVSLKSLF